MRRKITSFLSAVLLAIPTIVHAASGTPIGVPLPATSLTGVDANPGSNSISDIQVTWTISNASDFDGGSALTGFAVTAMRGSDSTTAVATSAVCNVPASDSSCVLTGINFATTYIFRIYVFNAVGSSTAFYSSTFSTKSQSQSVTINGNPGSGYKYGNSDFQLTAVTGSGLPVTWSSNSICSIDSNGIVHALMSGTCVVTAYQSGSGSPYGPAYGYDTTTVGINLSGTSDSATNVQGTSATLNATIPYPGQIISPQFCISTTNSIGSCTSPSGVTIGSNTPATIT